jgi:hypothetical protein
MPFDLGKIPIIGGPLATLLEPRNEGQYAGVDQANYQLPGAQGMSERDAALGQQYGLRGAPQAADSAQFRNYQNTLANMLNSRATGATSLSALALQRGQGQLARQQRGMMAGAAPQNAALAQRMGMQNTARGQQGLAYGTAMAGIQERDAAAQALAGLAGQARGQDIGLNQFNVGAQLQQTGLNDQAANNAYNRQLANAGMQQGGGIAYETQRGQRAGIQMQQPTQGEELLGLGMGIAGMAMQGGGGGGVPRSASGGWGAQQGAALGGALGGG